MNHTVSASIPKEIISIDLNLSKNSDTKETLNINLFFKGTVNLKYSHQIILGDFNQRMIQ